MLPGEPIGRRSATRGLRVQGLDQGNIWYNATVKQVHPDNSKVLLAFTGFGAAHNRWHILKDKTGCVRGYRTCCMWTRRHHHSGADIRLQTGRV